MVVLLRCGLFGVVLLFVFAPRAFGLWLGVFDFWVLFFCLVLFGLGHDVFLVLFFFGWCFGLVVLVLCLRLGGLVSFLFSNGWVLGRWLPLRRSALRWLIGLLGFLAHFAFFAACSVCVCFVLVFFLVGVWWFFSARVPLSVCVVVVLLVACCPVVAVLFVWLSVAFCLLFLWSVFFGLCVWANICGGCLLLCWLLAWCLVGHFWLPFCVC